MEALVELLAHHNEKIPLDVAALQLASIEFPGLNAEPSLNALDRIAEQLALKLPNRASGPVYLATANRVLFEELGFQGNETDYYDPFNSCLNEVISRRRGIPITLSILYIEVARRLNRPVHGIGLPGHFIVQYDDGNFSTFCDPFHGGRLLAEADCKELAQRIAGVDIDLYKVLLQPVSKRQILLRMLNNLRAVYFQRQTYRKALPVLNLIIEAMPDAVDEYKQRGVVHLHLRDFRRAKPDLERYLELAPKAEDRSEMEQQLARIRKWQAGLN